MKRVVITATGVISPVGLSTEAFWESLTAGRHGFAPIASFDPARVPVKCAAEVKGFDPVAMGLNKKDARRMDRYTQFAMAAAAELMEKAGDLGEVDPYRVGILVSSGIGGLMTTLNEHVKYMEKGPERLSVFTIPMMISNMAAGQLAIKYGFKGDNFAVVSACATGAHSVGEGFRKIKDGYLDLCIVGGSEAPICEYAVGVDIPHLLGGNARLPHGGGHGRGRPRPLRVGAGDVVGVVGGAVAHHLRQDVGPPGPGALVLLQEQKPRPLAHHKAAALCIERDRGASRILSLIHI